MLVFFNSGPEEAMALWFDLSHSPLHSWRKSYFSVFISPGPLLQPGGTQHGWTSVHSLLSGGKAKFVGLVQFF